MEMWKTFQGKVFAYAIGTDDVPCKALLLSLLFWICWIIRMDALQLPLQSCTESYIPLALFAFLILLK